MEDEVAGGKKKAMKERFVDNKMGDFVVGGRINLVGKIAGSDHDTAIGEKVNFGFAKINKVKKRLEPDENES